MNCFCLQVVISLSLQILILVKILITLRYIQFDFIPALDYAVSIIFNLVEHLTSLIFFHKNVTCSYLLLPLKRPPGQQFRFQSRNLKRFIILIVIIIIIIIT